MELFDLGETLHLLERLLPAQGPLREFIHHNTLHGFQDLPFHQAVRVAGQSLGAASYMPLSFFRARADAGFISPAVLKDIAAQQVHPHFSQSHAAASVTDLVMLLLGKAVPHVSPQEVHFVTSSAAFQRQLNHNTLLASLWNHCQDLGERSFNINPPPTGEAFLPRWHHALQTNVTRLVAVEMFRLTSAFMDQGVSYWRFPGNNQDSFLSGAKHLLAPTPWQADEPVEELITKLLSDLVGDERQLWQPYLVECMLSVRGWAGLCQVVAGDHPALFEKRRIDLPQFIAVYLLTQHHLIRRKLHFQKKLSALPTVRNSIADSAAARAWRYFSAWQENGKPNISAEDLHILQQEETGDFLARLQIDDLATMWQEAFEKTYHSKVLDILSSRAQQPSTSPTGTYEAQFLFCLDERECSIRRYLEEKNDKIETFGVAGFFGLDWSFVPLHEKVPAKRCPVPVTPSAIGREIPLHEDKFASALSRQRKRATLVSWARFTSHSWLTGWFVVKGSLFWALPKLLRMVHQRPRPNDSLIEEIVPTTRLDLGYELSAMADRVYQLLMTCGLNKHFAPFIFFVGHGSASQNNPYLSAYDCGACLGKSGAANARGAAQMANDPAVRALLRERGLHIPDSTRFLGALHNTCTDHVEIFDAMDLVDPSHPHHRTYKKMTAALNVALHRNAAERCRRFETTPLGVDEKKAVREVLHRSTALFEPRPELGHATNALTLIGPRNWTTNVFWDRRAFLISYDPSADSSGDILARHLGAVFPVCGGINLEYFFSRLDQHVYGAGTKLAHNLFGLVAVANGVEEDLRTGLPSQMVEIHDPVRLLISILQERAVVEKALAKLPHLANWVSGDWVKLSCVEPTTGQVWQWRQGTPELKKDPPATLQDTQKLSSQQVVRQGRDNLTMTYI